MHSIYMIAFFRVVSSFVLRLSPHISFAVDKRGAFCVSSARARGTMAVIVFHLHINRCLNPFWFPISNY